jgi:FkbM family methyltransferase
MDNYRRDELKKKILKRYELYKLQSSRFKRVLKDPLRTIPYFLLLLIAYRHPFKISYKTLWGDRMTFYLPEGNAIYYYGFFEANLTNFFINFLEEGDIFLDIGAHVGFYSILTSSLVGKSGQVHSFEPTPRTFASLKENAESKQNIVVNNNAVMDSEKEIEFSDYGPRYSAFNSFKSRTGSEMNFLSKPEIIKVKSISIDKYCAHKNISPNLIKIDAEGAEHLILESMTKTLQTIKPVVTIEVAGGEEWQENCKKSIELLTSNGYAGYEIDTDGYLHPHKFKESYSYDNLVFAHPDNDTHVRNLIK